MEFIAIQQTHSLQSNTYARFKILNNRIYYVWNARDIDNTTQVWFATSNLDGSNFVEMQLTDGSIGMNEPELYIYNNIIYLTWYGVSEDGGKYQIWITSMNIDGSDHKLLYITNTEFGAISPKIVIKNDVIYLAYQQRFLDYNYYHMVRANLNIDGTNFVSYTASDSVNETVRNVKLFVSDDLDDNKIYYIWTRIYPLDGQPSLHLYSSSNDLSDFTRVIIKTDSTAGNLRVVDDIIYFAWISGSAKFSAVNTDGTGYEDILVNDDYSYSLFQVTNNIIDFAISNQISSTFPTKNYQILAASLDINTSDYFETELISTITIGSNDKVNLQLYKNNNILYYVWQQYDENNINQIWVGIFGEDDPCEGVVCPDTCIGYDQWGQECDPDTGLCVVDRFIESQSESCDYEPSKLWLYLLLTLPPAAWISTRIVGEAKKRREL